MPIWVTILLSCIGTGGVLGFLQFLISRHDAKSNALKEIKEELAKTNTRLNLMEKEFRKDLKKSEKDSIRTQLLLLISDYPDNIQQIMTIAEYYFSTIRGNWYTTGIFQHYLEERNLPMPPWFNAEHHDTADEAERS